MVDPEVRAVILEMRRINQEWPVCIFSAPASHGFNIRIKKTGEKMVLHMGGVAYPHELLKASAPRWIGKPVFSEHKYQQPGTSDNRLHKWGAFGPVGYVKNAWWMPEEAELRGTIKVTSRSWQRTLLEALKTNTLHEIGLSQMVSVFFETVKVKVGNSFLPIVHEITEISSLDLTREPLSGGRFLDGGRNQGWIEEALAYRISLY